MKQSKTLRRISVAIVAALLITMSVLSVTLARYTTQITGSYSGTAYSWSITADSNTADFDVALDGEAYPGMASKDYTIAVANAGEVDAVLTAELTVTSKPTNMSIVLADVENLTTGVTLADGETVTVKVTVSWAYGENVDDTADQGKAVTFTVALTAEQAKA